MSYTSHGHPIPGSMAVEKGPLPVRARCGGPSMCRKCNAEMHEFYELRNVSKETSVPINAPDDFQEKAKRLLIDYVDSRHSTTFEVYIVWFVKVLQHWKALVCTNLPDDKYYELTYNGDRHETYIDEYVRVKNTVVPDKIL